MSRLPAVVYQVTESALEIHVLTISTADGIKHVVGIYPTHDLAINGRAHDEYMRGNGPSSMYTIHTGHGHSYAFWADIFPHLSHNHLVMASRHLLEKYAMGFTSY